MEKKETIFAKGIRFFKPNEKAPEFVKGNIVIERKEFIEFLNSCETDTVRIDLLKSKEKGTLYLTLNTFKPKVETIDYPKDDIKAEEIPF